MTTNQGKTEHTPTPWINSGNRVYMGAAMEKREIAVATRADPSIRAAADANAAFIVKACNAHDANVQLLAQHVARIAELEAALRAIEAYEPLTFAECTDAEAIIGIARAALKGAA